MMDSTLLFAHLEEKLAPFTADPHAAMVAIWPSIRQALIDSSTAGALLDDPFLTLTAEERTARGLGDYEGVIDEALHHAYDIDLISQIVEQVIERLNKKPSPHHTPNEPVANHPG